MASLSSPLSSFLFIIIVLCTFANGNTSPCPPFDCGNGITINYPFWLDDQGRQFEYCGYPGFNLSCSSENPTLLRLSDNLYYVKSTNYSEKSVVIAYSEFNNDDTICPKVPHDVVLETFSWFNYTSDDKTLRFFYNCSLYPPSLHSISCLQFGVKRSYVFTVGAIPEFDWDGNCESTVDVPVKAVIEKAVNELLVNDGFGRAVRYGFKLSWRPDSACQACETSGGFCGYSDGGLHQNFICYCPGGRGSSTCRDAGVVSISFQADFVIIGAVVFGSLIIAASIFSSIRRQKFESNIPVFSRIPSNQK